jgi:hypothetical protein
MVLYSSSGWEQQQLRRQMKCTINNSNTFFTIFQVINIRCFLHSHPNQAPHFTLTKLADNPLESHSPPPMKQLSATDQIRENRYICKSHKSRLLSGNRKIEMEMLVIRLDVCYGDLEHGFLQRRAFVWR